MAGTAARRPDADASSAARLSASSAAAGRARARVLDLLLRLRDPSSGKSLVDGVDLRDRQQRSWRAQIGIVFQENFLFNTTIRENIRLGWPPATDADVEAAARRGRGRRLHRQPAARLRHRGRRARRPALGRRAPAGGAGAGASSATRASSCSTRRPRRWIRKPRPRSRARSMRVARDRTVIAVTHRLASVAQRRPGVRARARQAGRGRRAGPPARTGRRLRGDVAAPEHGGSIFTDPPGMLSDVRYALKWLLGAPA